MASFLLEIVTPERQAFSDQVDMVVAPTLDGAIGVLAHHKPLFCILSEGEIKISTGTKDYFLAIGGGFMEVTASKVTVLVSRAVHADELNEAEIKKAQAAARDALANPHKGIEFSQAQAILRRSIMELKVLHRRKSSTRFN